MQFAKNNFPPLQTFPINKGWTVSSSRFCGQPLFVRINMLAGKFRAHPELPFRFGVAVPLFNPTKNGLPNKQEFSALNAIEDALCNTLQSHFRGFLVAVITANKMREFMFYITTLEDAAIAINSAEKCAMGHQLQHYVKEDREWNAYCQFV